MMRSSPARNRTLCRLACAALLVVAGCTAEEPAPELPAPEPSVAVAPQSGPTGSAVELQASGFPASTEVEIGFGPPRSEYSVIAHAQTDAAGELTRSVTVPTWAEAGRDYVFVVAGPRNQPKAISAPFRVSGSGT